MDELHRFIFEGVPVRGVLVRLDEAWREILARRAASEAGDYPAPVRHLLGEMTAAAALLQANIKFDGALILQLHGQGTLKLAVAEARSDLSLRATAQCKDAGDSPTWSESSLAELVDADGRGRCAITLMPQDDRASSQPYQGIVSLRDADGRPLPSLAATLEHYMAQSEQLQTTLVLAADDRTAAGLLVQRLPREGGGAAPASASPDDDEAFRRIAHLASSLTAPELLGLDAATIMRRLFWDDPHRLLDSRTPRFACRCSRAKVAGMLQALGHEEVRDIVAEQGSAAVHCDFCGAAYRFDAVDASALFVAAHDQAPGSGLVQ